MKRLVITAVTVSLSLAGVTGAVAQVKSVSGITTNADGSNVTSTAGLNPTANGEGGTIIYGDLNLGPGTNIIGPPSTVSTAPPAEAVPVAAPEPAPVTTTETTTTDTETAVTDTTVTDTTVTETAVATATDLDADNYADDLEWDLGLDPNNADTDADGVADGDEITIYGTEPTIYDTDGDGVSDGEELFGILTDPLVWDDLSGETSDAVPQETEVEASELSTEAPVESEALAQGTIENLTATDGNAAARGPGNASAAPGTVTRPGVSVLGPDGTYSVVDTAPSNVTIAGDTEVLAPPAAPAAAPTSVVAGCGSYGSWYDAQVTYEAAGMTSADPAVVSALDPDYDGIACEEGM
jgi:Bacterial TSP3 repeat